MPNLVNALSDFVSSVDRLVQTETKPDGLLKQMLPILVKLLPGTQALRLYRLSGAEVFPLAATDFDVKPQSSPVVDEDKFLNDAPKSDKPLFDADKSRWILTLRHGKQVLFLMEIIIKGDNITSDGEDLLVVVTNHLSSIFYMQSLHELLESQMLTFNGLVSGQNIAEAAYVVARNMLKRDSSQLIINKLVYGSDGQVSDWVSRVSADYKQRQVFDENEEPDLLWLDINSNIRQDLLDYEPFILHDLNAVDPDELGPKFYRWLEGKQVQSCLFLIIEQNGFPTGVLIVLDQDENVFGENEVNVFSNIVGYIGALTDVSKMSREINLSQRIVDNLVLANRLITTAANSAYMAQAVMYPG